MPNWCMNKVTISSKNGDGEELLQRIKNEVSEDYSEEVKGETVTGTLEFSFNSIIPMPEEVRNTNSPNNIVATQEEADAYNEEHKNDDFHRHAQTQQQVDDLYAKYGVANWYDWANQHWGTKWNVNEPELEDDGYELTYHFDTAWSPPVPIYEALAEKYPDAHISWFYDEPGMEFSGYLNTDKQYGR